MANFYSVLNDLSKNELIRLIEYYSRAFTVFDGFWFTNIKAHLGYEQATEIDQRVWKDFYPWEARHLRKLLNIEDTGVKGVIKIFSYMTWIHSVNYEISELDDQRGILSIYNCPVYNSLEKAGVETFPCVEGGEIGKKLFANTIDPRVGVKCILKPPRKSPKGPVCRWEFYLKEESNQKRTQEGRK